MPKIPTFLTALLLCTRLAATAQDEPVIRISDAADTASKTINLHPTAIQLPDVTVRPIHALTLIDSAIGRIPDNYPTRPFVSTGFYRITGRLYDTGLIKLNYLVTRIDTGFTAYSRIGKKIKTDKTIEHQVRENTTVNDNYWENYNAIEANFNVDSALAVIRANNSKAQRK